MQGNPCSGWEWAEGRQAVPGLLGCGKQHACPWVSAASSRSFLHSLIHSFILFYYNFLNFILFWLHLKTYGILALQPRIEPMLLAFKGGVLTTGLPRKSHHSFIYAFI